MSERKRTGRCEGGARFLQSELYCGPAVNHERDAVVSVVKKAKAPAAGIIAQACIDLQARTHVPIKQN